MNQTGGCGMGRFWGRQAIKICVGLIAVLFEIGSASAQQLLENATCDQLWLARNSIFARNGYCFKTPQAQAYFGPACFPPYGKLNQGEQAVVNAISVWESAKGCNVSLPNSLPASSGGKGDVFVMAGGEQNSDACYGVGEVVGLDPRGDGFLSVRSGPGGQPFSEIDRLFNGNRVFICDQRGPWFGVVYAGPGQASADQCGVNRPWALRQPYTGPCGYGWVHSRYVRSLAR